MKYYVTLTGLNYRYGTMPFAVGQKVRLVKEPENQADREAIRAELPGLGKVGYVANSTHTVKGDCYSAGRLYDKIGNTAVAKVKYILCDAVICKVKADTAAAVPPMNPDTACPMAAKRTLSRFKENVFMGKLTIRGEAAKEYAYDLMEISVQFWGTEGSAAAAIKKVTHQSENFSKSWNALALSRRIFISERCC